MLVAREIMRQYLRKLPKSAVLRAYRTSLIANRAAAAILIKSQSAQLPKANKSTRPARISVSVSSEIPRLAWLCLRNRDRFAFTIGSAVETFTEGFFEGVWDDEFPEGSRLPQALHFGSGVLYRDQPIFMPPKHLAEHIYILRNERTGIDAISNSLCFSLGAGEATPAFLQILKAELESKTRKATRLGAHRSKPLVMQDGDFSLYRMMYHNFSVDSGGGIALHPFYHGRNFRSFQQYRDFVASTMQRLFDNGNAAARRTRLSPMASISRGYDSGAVSCLAAGQGCRDAVTLAVSVNGSTDCGSEIAKQLGMQVQEFEHVLGANLNGLETEIALQKVWEFIATPGHGDDVVFAAFEPALRDRLFLTGSWGDSVWNRKSKVEPGLPMRARFEKSLSEYRLRVGFAHVPVPTIGAIYPKSIVAISQSYEMAPYSVGEYYDRPIPRRILEEAGIARCEFGFLKTGAAPKILNRLDLWDQAIADTMQRYVPFTHSSIPPS